MYHVQNENLKLLAIFYSLDNCLAFLINFLVLFRLDNLRTLILSDNLLDHLKIHTSTSRMIFPVLSMLDLSNNMIDMIPQTISELQNLSVLNISGNAKISDLPAQMGLLTKLWNLNTRGCSLHEPLATMMTSKTYKTSDVIGYLRYFSTLWKLQNFSVTHIFCEIKVSV